MGTTQYRKEIDYTICPVGNATYLAVNNGSLAEDLHAVVSRLLAVKIKRLVYVW